MKNRNPIISQFITAGALLLLLVVLSLLKTNTAICEFMATTFSRAWIWFTGNIFGWIPLSFYELFLIIAIISLIVCIVFIIKYLCKKRGKQALAIFLTIVIVALGGVNLYTVTASFSYEREPLPTEITSEYNGNDLTYDEALAIAEYFVEQVNTYYHATPHDEDGNVILPSLEELNDLLQEEYKRLDDGYFSAFTPNVKGILNKRIMSEMRITGVFFAPFGEPNINVNSMNVFTPSTMAHELAHSKGVMRESDANTVSAYLLLTSDNAFLRYSGYVDCLSDALRIVYMYPDSAADYGKLYDSVDKGVRKELSNYAYFWGQFTLFNDIGEFFNDLYLKLQGVGSGTDSYVKPPVYEGTGELDGDGNEIINIISFSNIQNLVINLYKQGQFN